jgi:hypothetical protein
MIRQSIVENKNSRDEIKTKNNTTQKTKTQETR